MSETSEHKIKEVDWDQVDLNGKEKTEEAVLPEAGPIVMDDERFEEEEREREQAFSSEPEWKGSELQPFSYSRKALFYQQRLAMGAPDLGEVLGDGAAFLGDAIRILFLCAHDPSQYRHLRSKPLLLQERIDEWGDEQILTETDEVTATTVAIRLLNGSEVNQPEAVPAGNPGREDELGN